MESNSGMVYVFTGNGKGKTSAALGVALRAAGNGMRVAWVAWYKQASWGISELKSLEILGIEAYLLGKGFYIDDEDPSIVGHRNDARSTQDDTDDSKSISSVSNVKMVPVGTGEQKVVDTSTEDEHVLAAGEALLKARELVRSGTYDLVVMDEVNNAMADKLIDRKDLVDLISERKQTHLILTGRNVADEVVSVADLVTEMKKVKHPYDEGRLAVKGLDF